MKEMPVQSQVANKDKPGTRKWWEDNYLTLWLMWLGSPLLNWTTTVLFWLF